MHYNLILSCTYSTLLNLLIYLFFLTFLRKKLFAFFVGLFGFVFCFFCVHPLFLFFTRVGKVDTPPGNAFISNYTYEGGLKREALMSFSNPKKLPSFFRWMGVCNSLFFLRCALKSLSNNLTLFSKIKNTLTPFKLKLSDYFFKQKTLCVFT